jgi:uncharacterized delta-60 repeat protein
MSHFSSPRFSRYSLLQLALTLACIATSLSAQTAVPYSTDGFNPNVSGLVNAVVVQRDGKVVFGGTFNQLQPNSASLSSSRGNLARVNVDGTLDSSYDPEPNGQVLAMALQPDGKLIIGGNFTTLQPNGIGAPVIVNHIARLNPDGSLDTTFANLGVTGTYTSQVYGISLQANGQIIIGGAFVSVGTTTRNHVARLNADGSLDTTFNPNANGIVTGVFVEKSGQVLIGGAFSTVQPNGAAKATTRGHLARLNADGSVDTSFDPEPNNAVTGFAQQLDGKVIIVGSFATLTPGLAANTAALPVTSVSIARLNDTDGSPDLTFNASASAAIQSVLITHEGKIIIAGSIGSISNGSVTISTPNIARLNADGTADVTYLPNPNYSVNAIAEQADGKIIAGGMFTQLKPNYSLSGVYRNAIARINIDGSLDTNFDPNAYGGIGAIAVQANGQFIIAGSFSSIAGMTRANLARLNANGSLDTTFDPEPNGIVQSLAIQSDGKILVGGSFTTFQPNGATTGSSTVISRGSFARLNTDGTVDQTFDPEPSGPVSSILIQPDGNILIGGTFFSFSINQAILNQQIAAKVPTVVTGNAQATVSFTEINSSTAGASAISGYLVTASSGSTVVSTNSGTKSPVVLTGLTNGQTYTYAVTVILNSTLESGLARIKASDGSLDQTFLPNPSGPVNSIVYEAQKLAPATAKHDQIIIGGDFTSITPAGYKKTVTSMATYIARIDAVDGSVDTTFQPNPNGVVETLALQPNGQIIVGGTFSTLTPNPTTKTTVTGTTVTTVTTQPTPRQFIARLNIDGSLDTNFDPQANGPVLSVGLNQNNGQIIVGGIFSSIAGASRNNVARINSSGTIDNGFTAGVNGIVDVILCAADNSFYIGGSFSSVSIGNTITAAGHLSRFTGDGNRDANFNVQLTTGTKINTLALDPTGNVLIGGSFVNIAGGYATNLVRLHADTSFDTTLAANPDGPINAIAVQADGSLYVGGSFSTIGIAPINAAGDLGSGKAANFAHIGGNSSSLDLSFTAFPDAAVNAVFVQPSDGKILIGGSFNNVGTLSSSRIARYNANGTVDTTFSSALNSLPYIKSGSGSVNAIVMKANGQIIVGGSLVANGSTTGSSLVQLNPNGSIDAGFTTTVNQSVTGVLQQPNGQIVISGSFTQVNGVARGGIARLNANGSLDTAFNPNANGTVNSIALQIDGSVVMGGTFTSVGGLSRNYIARVTSTGAVDSTFNPGADAAVTGLAIGSDGKLIVIGSFSTLAGQPRNGFGRLSQTGITIQGITVANDLSTITLARSGTGPAFTTGLFQWSTDGLNWTTLGVANGTIPSNMTTATVNTLTGVSNATEYWSLTGVNVLPSSTPFYIQVLGSSETSQGTSTSLVQYTQQFYINSTPQYVGPSTINAVLGQPVYLNTDAVYGPTNYLITGLPTGLTYNALTGIISGTPTKAGSYTVSLGLTNATGTTNYTVAFNVAASAPVIPVGPSTRLINLSTLACVTTPVTDGFVITDPSGNNGAKNVLIRGIGPALLNYGIPAPILKTKLTIMDSSGRQIASNTGWDGSASLSQIFAQVGAFPLKTGSLDSVLALSLKPGSYTATVTSTDGTTGDALVEIYDADANPLNMAQRLVNVSSMDYVSTGYPVIGGFSILGNSPKTILIRGDGPTLASYGSASPLADPVLKLYKGQTVIASNTGWSTPTTVNTAYPGATAAAISAAIASSGAFSLPSGSKDSAILVTLPPGTYTAQITSASSGNGQVMVEIYELPNGN